MSPFPSEQIVVIAGQAAIFILNVTVLALKKCDTWAAGPCMHFVTLTPLGMNLITVQQDATYSVYFIFL